MSKIKLNLVSGVSVEKPLINAFQSNQNKYLVLDNEMNGSMGYPIILVSKIVDNKVVKITDPSEWESVKNCLKQIIAGNNLEYYAVDPVINADDIYYTQLTLPVTSFDTLKNAYKINVVEETITPEQPANVPIMENNSTSINQSPIEPVIPEINQMVNNTQPNIEVAPVFNYAEPNVISNNVVNEPVSSIPVAPVVEPVIQSVPETPTINNVPVADQNNNFINPNSINIEMPTFTNQVPTPETPVADINPVFNDTLNMNNVINEPSTISPVIQEPVVAPADTTTTIPLNNEVTNNEDIFASQKEAFMEACSNMFDALVQKFEKELNKNKQD